ncbi:MAG: DUF6713 family protein [Thermodesulfobacteriota bacterium]
MWDWLVWLYIINATLLINHEIDSAYWKEWELFRLPGGADLFVALHLPLVLVILYGLLLVFQKATAGIVLSLALAAGGLGAFFLHIYFLRQGRPEFRTALSLFLLIATLVVSVIQAAVALYALAA